MLQIYLQNEVKRNKSGNALGPIVYIVMCLRDLKRNVHKM